MTGLSKPSKDQAFAASAYSTPAVVDHYAEAATSVGLWESERKLCNRYLASEDVILDIGCGAGRTTVGLYCEGFMNICGLDISSAMVFAARTIAARSGLHIPFFGGNACQLPFSDESFNGVLFSYNGLMQIPGTANRLRALREIYRVMTNGATFIFTTPEREWRHCQSRTFWSRQRDVWNRGNQDSRLRRFGDVIAPEVDSTTYLHFPTIEEVIRVIWSVGFQLLDYRSRKQVSLENPVVERFLFETDCIMWVTRKPHVV